jgi:hypothetical protein
MLVKGFNVEEELNLKIFKRVYPVGGKTDIGKPFFNASDGGRVDILRQSEEASRNEL